MIYDLDRRSVLSHAPRPARTLWERLRGMIGRRFEGFDAMIFERCSAVHTCFMTQSIDVLFLDGGERVTAVWHAVPPWRLWVSGRGGVVAIEFPAGVLARAGVGIGDFVNWHFNCDPAALGNALAAGEGER